jgi:hypothetical protein
MNHTLRVARNAAIDYFMPLVLLHRWFKALDKGEKTISIERPWSQRRGAALPGRLCLYRL